MRGLVLSLLLVAGCPSAVCGDGVLDAGEACDDGNSADADGCEADCSLPACENGILDPGELCLAPPVELATDLAPTEILALDLNRDGALDLVTGNIAGESLSVFLGVGDGSFTRLPDVELPGGALPLVAADLDGDGLLDLVTSLFTGAPSIAVLRGLGDGSFAFFLSLPADQNTESLAVGDFDNDGKTDLVAGDTATGGKLFLGDGDGGFLAPSSFSAAGLSVLAVSDFNGDEALDLATVLVADGSLFFFLGDGLGGFSPLDSGLLGARALSPADFDGDGALDLVGVRGGLAGELVLLQGDGAGGFAEVQALPTLGLASLTVGDLNSDGALDVAGAGGIDSKSNSAALAPFLGGEDGFALLPRLEVGPADPRGVALGDFNGDGALDAVLSDQSTSRFFLFLSVP